jgi:hypothetical protein
VTKNIYIEIQAGLQQILFLLANLKLQQRHASASSDEALLARFRKLLRIFPKPRMRRQQREPIYEALARQDGVHAPSMTKPARRSVNWSDPFLHNVRKNLVTRSFVHHDIAGELAKGRVHAAKLWSHAAA